MGTVGVVSTGFVVAGVVGIVACPDWVASVPASVAEVLLCVLIGCVLPVAEFFRQALKVNSMQMLSIIANIRFTQNSSHWFFIIITNSSEIRKSSPGATLLLHRNLL